MQTTLQLLDLVDVHKAVEASFVVLFNPTTFFLEEVREFDIIGVAALLQVIDELIHSHAVKLTLVGCQTNLNLAASLVSQEHLVFFRDLSILTVSLSGSIVV